MKIDYNKSLLMQKRSEQNGNGPFRSLLFRMCRSILAHDEAAAESDLQGESSSGPKTEPAADPYREEKSTLDAVATEPFETAEYLPEEAAEQPLCSYDREAAAEPCMSYGSDAGTAADLYLYDGEMKTLHAEWEDSCLLKALPNESAAQILASEEEETAADLNVSKEDRTADSALEELSEANDRRIPPIFPVSNNLEEVYRQLKYTDIDGKKVLAKDICNVETILETDDRIAGKIAYNAFTGQTIVRGDVPWNAERTKFREYTDTDTAALLSILQRDYGINSQPSLDNAVMLVTNRHRFNPLIDLLESFKWDGEDHIRKLLPYYMGAEDSNYIYEVMRLVMLAAVKRVFQPGIKWDFVLVLQSLQQGIGKSTFCRKLALSDEYFSDSLVSLDGDDAAKSLIGVWIVELPELKAIQQTKGGDEAVKRFISAPQDRLRLPYEKRYRTYPRQFIMIGTVNSFDFLEDITGNRRYLIAECAVNPPHTKELFTEAAMEDIRGAWAQAVHIFKTENPSLDDLPKMYREEAEVLRRKHTADDGARGLILDFLKDKDRTCSLEIWQEVLHEKRAMTKKDSRIISDTILSDPNWEHTSAETYGQYGKQRLFKRKRKLE